MKNSIILLTVVSLFLGANLRGMEINRLLNKENEEEGFLSIPNLDKKEENNIEESTETKIEESTENKIEESTENKKVEKGIESTNVDIAESCTVSGSLVKTFEEFEYFRCGVCAKLSQGAIHPTSELKKHIESHMPIILTYPYSFRCCYFCPIADSSGIIRDYAKIHNNNMQVHINQHIEDLNSEKSLLLRYESTFKPRPSKKRTPENEELQTKLLKVQQQIRCVTCAGTSKTNYFEHELQKHLESHISRKRMMVLPKGQVLCGLCQKYIDKDDERARIQHAADHIENFKNGTETQYLGYAEERSNRKTKYYI
jgi:hypothetical protein